MVGLHTAGVAVNLVRVGDRHPSRRGRTSTAGAR